MNIEYLFDFLLTVYLVFLLGKTIASLPDPHEVIEEHKIQDGPDVEEKKVMEWKA